MKQERYEGKKGYRTGGVVWRVTGRQGEAAASKDKEQTDEKVSLIFPVIDLTRDKTQ